MKKNITYILVLIVILIAVAVLLSVYSKTERKSSWDGNLKTASTQEPFVEGGGMNDVVRNRGEEKGSNPFFSPMDRVSERVTKKPFGIFISPQNSPVSPERFSGFHTAVDLEVFADELEAEIKIPVKAICAGKILAKRSANGYGGVAVQECEIEETPVTVIYGHLNLSSIEKKVGDDIGAGETLGVLGNGYSSQTDGERKHLHLGIRKGREMNILGYVQDKNQLSDWIDPCLYFCDR